MDMLAETIPQGADDPQLRGWHVATPSFYPTTGVRWLELWCNAHGIGRLSLADARTLHRRLERAIARATETPRRSAPDKRRA